MPVFILEGHTITTITILCIIHCVIIIPSGAAQSSPGLSRKPRLHELDRLKGNGLTVKVIERTAAYWERVALRLHFEGHEIDTIKADYHQSEDAGRKMFSEWLEGKGRQPKTWETVLSALNEAGFGEIASDLSDALHEY